MYSVHTDIDERHRSDAHGKDRNSVKTNSRSRSIWSFRAGPYPQSRPKQPSAGAACSMPADGSPRPVQVLCSKESVPTRCEFNDERSSMSGSIDASLKKHKRPMINMVEEQTTRQRTIREEHEGGRVDMDTDIDTYLRGDCYKLNVDIY